ncbi:MAG: tRNA glutamyl-Q(34) synthetase GluQRS [Verrucomicrobiales bacterium]|nr:tRNA glutamyl-Q(34) synthetase GluQRS [Verrucomicrobiales bacterium]
MITRFAPSPTGLLHLGHAFSALTAWDEFQKSEESGKRFLLRIEDIDFTRCRPEFEEKLLEDLEWLGLKWETPVRRQSEHLEEYQGVADQLRERGLLYPCFCTRKEILAEIARAGGAPHGSEGPIYPGICRDLSADEQATRIERGDEFALRIDLEKALAETGELTWKDKRFGEVRAKPELLGDAVLARKDIGTSYHLAVVCDDVWQGVTHITRGEDLLESTHLHRVLQELLDFPEPKYFHHELITDTDGKRLAKRDESETLQSLREAGWTPDEIRTRLQIPISG